MLKFVKNGQSKMITNKNRVVVQDLLVHVC